ncbi:OmpH family outer membrane protein [Brumimicrobium salinarum]|nr:OmpH family outer membrane protein [Brumimicrobium salinarum]
MKNILLISTLILGSVAFFTSCNNSNNENVKNETPVKVVEKKQMGEGETGIAMAYYHQDSIATQFGFYREIDSVLKSKELNFQKELERKYRAYQAYEADVQKRMEANEITGYQIEDIQRTAMEKQQAIQQFEQQRGAALQKESMEYQTALMNKIAEAGKEFSNKKDIDLLFFYQKGGQITFINNAYDVTDEFINFLNDREEELMSGFEDEVEAIQEVEEN